LKYRVVLGRPRVSSFLSKVGVAALWLLGGGGLIVFVFGLTFYLAMSAKMRSTEVQVPDLAGLTLDSATEKADPLGLVLSIVDRRNDPAVSSDRILQQVPSAGASVRRGRKIKLVMSLGGRVLRVPDIVGHAARAVEIELRQGGFAPGFEVHVPSSTASAGKVLAQVPPAETPAVPNTRVHRLVSEGPAKPAWVMPDLIGRSRTRVEGRIEQAGFRVAVRRVRIPGRKAGMIVGQLPLAGYPIRSNDIVELTVAE